MAGDLSMDQILIDDDEFAPDPAAAAIRLDSSYFRNRPSSQGGKLTDADRKIVAEIFDPEDAAFVEAARSAFR